MTKKSLKETLTFGFEQTLTIEQWWTEPGFTSTSDTPVKREKMLLLAQRLADVLEGSYFESKDIWDHMQYEVADKKGETQFFVTMDPGSIELKTPPCLIDDIENMATPIFKAIEGCDIVPYRNWWYGVKGGTEGGCHVNMGGFTEETNPLKAQPDLVVKYAAYVHNRPWLHYPFMGPDVGAGGNAMRLDEKDGFTKVVQTFKEYNKALESGKSFGPQETYDFFKETNLIAEKSSYPSLYKFKTGLFLIEDRAQEALREAHDFYLVALLRLKILEKIKDAKLSEPIKSFSNLHTDFLCSDYLWDQFNEWAKSLDLDPAPFKRFFDRQWPVLSAGENIPQHFILKDGRRPRVIKDIQKRGDVVISKTIDTSFKRFEVSASNCHGSIEFLVDGEGIEFISEPIISNTDNRVTQFIDIKVSSKKPVLNVCLKRDSKQIEDCSFDINDMMWSA